MKVLQKFTAILLISASIICLQVSCNKKKIRYVGSDYTKIVFYPNPAVTGIRASVYNLEAGSTLQISNPSGKEIFNENTDSQNMFVINLSNEPAGLYQAVLSEGDSIFVLNFIKLKQ
jgi:hypothetical protein